MRALVCGGRDFCSGAFVRERLDAIHAAEGITLVITGGARGVDTLASQWATDKAIPQNAYRADWQQYGKSAGPIRNEQMLREGKPDCVIAFPGSRGTNHMVSIARHAGVRVIRQHPSGGTITRVD